LATPCDIFIFLPVIASPLFTTAPDVPGTFTRHSGYCYQPGQIET
jgi:hypothetical protein